MTTDPSFPFDDPIDVPAPSTRGPGYDAALDRGRAAFKAARSALPVTTVVNTVADLARIAVALPAEMPVLVDDIIRAVPAPDSDPDRRRTIVTTAGIATILDHPRTTLHSDAGEPFGELAPALELGLLALPDRDPHEPDVPMPTDRSGCTALHPAHRLAEAFEEGRADTGMSAGAEVASRLADELETHLNDALPGGRIPPEVMVALQQLREAADALRYQAPTVHNLITE